jgi:thiamine kinase-like enzyme
MDLEAALAQLWPGQAVESEPLGGGITNRNFKVVVGTDVFVVRIGGKDTELLGIDRTAEYHASLVAAELGIGPEVIAFVEAACFVARYIDGVPISPERLREPDGLARAAAVLRRLHGGPPMPSRFDAFRVVESYREIALAHGVPEPSLYRWAKDLADEIEAARGAAEPVPCHNDLLNANLIDDETGIRIVDWEYAGMGDRFFDLANFSVNHELEEEHDRALLAAYFGAGRDEDFAALALMRFMSDFREAMWGVVQLGISELDFDFAAYAEEHFERLQRTASSARFGAALI